MATYKCKMCGANLTLSEGATVTQCEYCGSQQTVPAANDEKKMIQFSRANQLRLKCEFDKAAGIYESIVADFPEEPEAYWGLVLCKYGIEYVDDPKTHKRIPTCHRTSVENVTEDADYRKALEYADPVAKILYQEEAVQIEALCRSILEVSGKEEPFDIFICYKETDENGDRTLDSVIAQEVYDALTEKGYRVFFSRITLENKLGTQYEPYIFAALNSAKVMLAFGTDPDYFNAVWVKNEWSRFLQLISKGEKKTLIPCYKDIDPSEMPKEFARLQSQDLGKLGATQDLLRGIEKLLSKGKKETTTERVIVRESSPQSATVESLITRAFMFLEDRKWDEATDYCNRVLDINPEEARAYVGLLMADNKKRKQGELKSLEQPFDNDPNYRKILTYGDTALAQTFKDYIKFIKDRNEENRKSKIYSEALNLMNTGETQDDFQRAAELFLSIPGYKDADVLCISAPYKYAKELIKRSKQKFNSLTEDKELNKILQECGAVFSTIQQLPKRKDSETVISDLKQIISWGRNYLLKRNSMKEPVSELNSEQSSAGKRQCKFGGKFKVAVVCSAIAFPIASFASFAILSTATDKTEVLSALYTAIAALVILVIFLIRFFRVFFHNRMSKKKYIKLDQKFILLCKDFEYLLKIDSYYGLQSLYLERGKFDYKNINGLKSSLADYAHSLISEKNYLKAYDILLGINKKEAENLFIDHYQDFIPGLS